MQLVSLKKNRLINNKNSHFCTGSLLELNFWNFHQFHLEPNSRCSSWNPKWNKNGINIFNSVKAKCTYHRCLRHIKCPHCRARFPPTFSPTCKVVLTQAWSLQGVSLKGHRRNAFTIPMTSPPLQLIITNKYQFTLGQ